LKSGVTIEIQTYFSSNTLRRCVIQSQALNCTLLNFLGWCFKRFLFKKNCISWSCVG